MKINDEIYNTLFIINPPILGKRDPKLDFIQLSEEDQALINLALQGMCVDLTIRAATFLRRHHGES